MPIKSALPKPNPIKPPPMGGDEPYKPAPINPPSMGGGYNKPYKPKSPGQAVPLQPPAYKPKSESDFYRQLPPDENERKFVEDENGYLIPKQFARPPLPSINPKQDYGGALDPEQPRVLNKDDRARQDQEMYARLDEERKKQEMLDRVQPSPNPSYGQSNPPAQVDPNDLYLQEYDMERSQPNQTDPDVPDFNEYEIERSQLNPIEVPPNYDKPNEPNFISPPPDDKGPDQGESYSGLTQRELDAKNNILSSNNIDIYTKPNIKTKLPPLRPPPL